jgi:hypothetical protein
VGFLFNTKRGAFSYICMKAKIKVPSSLSEITLGQYQQFKKTADKFDGQNDFLLQKMVEIFCNIPLSHVLLIKRKSLVEITSQINSLFNEERQLQNTFKLKELEFGFIPNLEKITQGEYVDLDTYIVNWENMHKAMAVLYRPIKNKKGDKYELYEYQGTDEFAELMKFTPMDTVLGAYVFFYRLGNELLSSTLEFLKVEALEMITQCKDSSVNDGDGIIHSINSLTENYKTLMKSEENPFISALHFSLIK